MEIMTRPKNCASRPALPNTKNLCVRALGVWIFVFALLVAQFSFAAPPGVVIDYSPKSSGLYIGSPSLAVLPNGDYLASHDFFGPSSKEHECPTVAVFRSSDRGATWAEVARLKCLFWANLFTHRDAVYLMGTDKHHGRIVIRRSTDGGVSWTDPRDSRSGLLTAQGAYHTAPVPVVEHQGRLWRAFEDASGGTKWGERYAAGMLSIPVDADLLNATNWLFSNFLSREAAWLKGDFRGWLEGNAVVTRESRLVNILRVDTPGCPEKAAIVDVSADGKTTSFDPATGFIDFPGGAKKFTIRFDKRSNLYWSLATIVPDRHQNAGRPASIRNTLALVASPDLQRWTTHCVLLYHSDIINHGFQYPDWHFDGDDLIGVVRTAFDDAEGGAHNNHDANYMTFHRWKNFRELTMSNSVTIPESAGAGTGNEDRTSPRERQISRGPGGRIVTNTGVWSPDSKWIVYDTRSDPAGEKFDGSTINMVNVETGEVKELYRSVNGAHCGAATFHPREQKVAFILGPEKPTPDWQYNAYHRQGVIVDVLQPGVSVNLDARDLSPPFTPGALRGGSHVHVWDASGDWVSFTYEDHVLAQFESSSATNDINLRNIGVSVPFAGGVKVSNDHPRNHSGEYFTVLVTRTTPNPKPGSDEIKRACEEGWIGSQGYLRVDGTRQRRALTFLGHVVTREGETISEVFVVDLPEDLTVPGDGPLCGTATRAPAPPKGVTQRRLTFTADRKFPGIQGPRHWLRCSPDGTRIAFLMKDHDGVVQLWSVSPNGGSPVQMTRNSTPIVSTFTWSPDGSLLTYLMDGSVCVTDVSQGKTRRLTARADDAGTLRPEACVFSPDGRKIAFVRHVVQPGGAFNQICVAFLAE
jgi:hypothetical protein